MKVQTFLAAIFSIISLTISFEVLSEEKAERPAYNAGECWKFRELHRNYISSVSGDQALPSNGLHEICYVEGNFVEVTDGAKIALPKNGLWSPILFTDEQTRYIKFPIYPGKETTEDYQANVRGTNRKERRKSIVRVTGVEPVTSSAGTFRAFKIVRENYFYGKLLDKWQYFYSAETKSMVKYNYEAVTSVDATREVELLEFRPAK